MEQKYFIIIKSSVSSMDETNLFNKWKHDKLFYHSRECVFNYDFLYSELTGVVKAVTELL